MEQTLLNEIVARVAAKLAEAEGGEAAPAAADRDDREGLLLLSQEMNDTCRAMLKCEKLKARFRVDCASLQSEPAELDSYGVVVLTGLRPSWRASGSTYPPRRWSSTATPPPPRRPTTP